MVLLRVIELENLRVEETFDFSSKKPLHLGTYIISSLLLAEGAEGLPDNSQREARHTPVS